MVKSLKFSKYLQPYIAMHKRCLFHDFKHEHEILKWNEVGLPCVRVTF